MNRKRLTDALKAEHAPIGQALRPGESRTVNLYDEHRTITGQITIYRTDRSYANDLADAYNANLSPDSIRRGLQWTVLPNGELHLGISEDFTARHAKHLADAAEADRRQFNHRQRFPAQGSQG